MTRPKHDLILAGGHIVDPASGTNMISDVAIHDGAISEIGRDLPDASGREIIDVSGQLVLPGLIDTHAHVYEHVIGRFGLNPDRATPRK